MAPRILVFGATGLMMSHVLPHLMKEYGIQVAAFVRPESKGIPFLSRIGVDVIQGAWDDVELIKKSIKGFDIVWDAGDSHDPSLPKLLVPLLIENVEPITFVRYTGTGNWITQTGGNEDQSARTYDDADPGDIAALQDEMFNGAGDLIALNALKKGLNVWLLCTGGVYGPAQEGISSTGVFVRLYTGNALQLGYCPYVGSGTAHMQLIHIDDVISATEIFLQQVMPTIGKSVNTDVAPHTRFFNAPGYSYTWKHLAETWSSVLSKNLSKNIGPKQVEMGEAGSIAPLINAEMKSYPGKLTQMGWKPTGPSIEQTLANIVKA